MHPKKYATDKKKKEENDFAFLLLDYRRFLTIGLFPTRILFQIWID